MNQEESYKKLVNSIESLIKVYRSLLAVVRNEKEILVSANLDDLNENNRAKEKMLIELRSLERDRKSIVEELLMTMNISDKNLSLLDLAKHLSSSEKGDKLRSLHSVLDLLVKRVKDLNKSNEELIQSALANISGAMNSIKDMLIENKTYQKKGAVQEQSTQAGQLVSREA